MRPVKADLSHLGLLAYIAGLGVTSFAEPVGEPGRTFHKLKRARKPFDAASHVVRSAPHSGRRPWRHRDSPFYGLSGKQYRRLMKRMNRQAAQARKD